MMQKEMCTVLSFILYYNNFVQIWETVLAYNAH